MKTTTNRGDEMTSTFYTESRSGDRVWVTAAGVKIERGTHTTNPHQPARKWYVTARPKDAAAYAAKKVAAGEWVAVADRTATQTTTNRGDEMTALQEAAYRQGVRLPGDQPDEDWQTDEYYDGPQPPERPQWAIDRDQHLDGPA